MSIGPNELEKVKELLEQLGQVDPADTASLLARANVSPAVAREVSSLLRHAIKLESNEAVNNAELLTTPPQLGTGLEVIEKIGQGATSDVFLAKQTKGFERLVAVKIPRPALQLPLFRTWLQIEAQALAKLTHPNIARVIDYGNASDGRIYLVLEYVAGPTLDQFSRRETVTLKDSVELIRQISRAVQQAHDLGIRHGDLSPDNVLVCEQDLRPFARIIDFGLASVANEFRVGGKQTFAAPEQLETDGVVDNRSDIFSIGKILHSIVEAKGVAARDEDLHAIVEKATQQIPCNRYSSASQLADDIERWQRTMPVAARKTPLGHRVRLWMKRQPVLAAVVGATVLLGISGLIALTKAWYQTGLQKQLAEERLALSIKAMEESESTLQLLESWLSTPDPQRKGPDAKVADLLAQAEKTLADQKPQSSRLKLRTELILANTYAGLGDYMRARTLSDRIMADKVWETIDDKLLSKRVFEHRGRLLMQMQQYADAEACLRQAWKLAIQTGEKGPGLAKAIGAIGNSLQQQGLLKESLDYYRFAVRELTDSLGTDSPELARLQTDMAPAMHQFGDAAAKREAEEIAERSAKRLDVAWGRLSVDTITAWHNYGALLMAGGQNERAETVMRDVVQRRAETLPPLHPLRLGAEVILGRIQLRISASQSEGESRLTTVFEENLEQVNPEQPWSALAADAMATHLRNKNEYAQAIPWHQKAIDANARIFGNEHWQTESYRVGLLRTKHAAGDTAKALEELMQVSTRIGDQLPASHPVRKQVDKLIERWNGQSR